MKGFISVFALSARAALFKTLGIIAAMAAAETGVYIFLLRKYGQSLRAEEILDLRIFTIIVLAGLILTASATALSLRKNGRGTPAYTIARLSITEKMAVFSCSLYNLCILLIFAAVQILLFWGFCRLYIARTESPDAAHMIFLAFSRSDLMDKFMTLPLSLQGLPNALVIIALSAAAGYSITGRSLFPFGFILLTTAVSLWFTSVETAMLNLCASGIVLLYIPVALNSGNSPFEEIQLEGINAESAEENSEGGKSDA